MNTSKRTVNVAVLDDYQGVALTLADWSKVTARARVTVFNDHLDDPDALVERLLPFDVVCVMRERTPLRRQVIERLPKLKLIASTAMRNASIDADAAAERGIAIVHTSYSSSPTVELTWALILAGAQHIVSENTSLRAGGWQRSVGDDLAGKTLGIVGLGNIGAQVAKVGLAFGMQDRIAAWIGCWRRRTSGTCLGAYTSGSIATPSLTSRRGWMPAKGYSRQTTSLAE